MDQKKQNSPAVVDPNYVVVPGGDQSFVEASLALTKAKWDRVKEWARMIAETKMFSGYDTAPKVMAAWALAPSLRVDMMQALRMLYPSKDPAGGIRLALWADSLWGLLIRAGWQFKWLEQTRERAAVEVWHPEKHPTHQVFEATVEEARIAGIDKKHHEFLADQLVAWVKRRAVRRTESGLAQGIVTVEELPYIQPFQQPAEPPRFQSPRKAHRAIPQSSAPKVEDVITPAQEQEAVEVHGDEPAEPVIEVEPEPERPDGPVELSGDEL